MSDVEPLWVEGLMIVDADFGQRLFVNTPFRSRLVGLEPGLRLWAHLPEPYAGSLGDTVYASAFDTSRAGIEGNATRWTVVSSGHPSANDIELEYLEPAG